MSAGGRVTSLGTIIRALLVQTACIFLGLGSRQGALGGLGEGFLLSAKVVGRSEKNAIKNS